MIIIASLLLIAYAIFYLYIAQQLLKADYKYLLFYCILFLPVYTVFLNVIYVGFRLPLLNQLLQYSKEVLIFGGAAMLIFGSNNHTKRLWKLSFLDKAFISFTTLAVIYAVLPIGEASALSKIVYLKNILLVPIFYLFGRNVKLSYDDWKTGFKLFLGLTLVTSVLVVIEKAVGLHLHALIDSPLYHSDMKEIDLKGVFGIGYTFEAQGGKPRYASLYANPLELSASMLILAAYTIYMAIKVNHRTNKLIYLFFFLLGVISLLSAYSRATFLAFFSMLIFMALQLKYYRIIVAVLASVGFFAFYFVFLASNDLRYFVIDTITFQNSSSVTHIIDWLEAIESMVNNPMGIGLGTSGNMGGVESDLIVGGENQFLIYGVQMGFLSAIIYVVILFVGVKHCFDFQHSLASSKDKLVAFVAASVKFGLLIPMMTSNVEAYLFISLVTWWMIGQGESQYLVSKKHMKYSNPINRLRLQSKYGRLL